MDFTLNIWRQDNANAQGSMKEYKVAGISSDTSFLEMLDVLNQQLIEKGDDVISFDNDCREGVCGMCSLYINGEAHGPKKLVTTCQLYMRSFKDGQTIYIEPFRAKAFPVIKDLVVDRSAFERIQQAGGYTSFNTGSAPEANDMPFVSAKVSQFAYLPQGQVEAADRVRNMVAQMDLEGFGNCTNTGACEVECPKGISLDNIARMNRELMKADLI